MNNGNGTSIKGPWWITVVERMGGLGIVLVMLIGIFLIGRDYAEGMRGTWSDIHAIIEKENALDSEYRQRSDDTLNLVVATAEANNKFLTQLADTLHKRLESIESRLDRLESSK